MIESILKWYAIICLFCTPFSFISLIYIIKKKPTLIVKFNNAIDKLIGETNDSHREPQIDSKIQSTIESQPKDIEEQNEDIGITNINLIIGDTYKCYLTAENIQNIGISNLNDWKSSNPFVAGFDDKNNPSVIFANKVGKAIIYSGDIEIYHLNVKTNETGAFAFKHISCLLERQHYSNIKVRNIGRRVLKDSIQRRMLIMSTAPNCPRTKYKWDKNGNVSQVLFEFHATNIKWLNESEKLIKEFFTKLECSKEITDVSYYYHCAPIELIENSRYIFNDEIQGTDFVAMIRKTEDFIYFGASVIWRQGADINEVQNNPHMIDWCFEGLLPESIMPQRKNIEPTPVDNINIQQITSSPDRNATDEDVIHNTEKLNESSRYEDKQEHDTSNYDDVEANLERQDYDIHEDIDPNEDDDEEKEIDDLNADPM